MMWQPGFVIVVLVAAASGHFGCVMWYLQYQGLLLGKGL